MDRRHALALVEKLFEMPAGTLQGGETLTDIDTWSSLTALGFMVLADEHFKVVPSPDALAGARTVNDLLGLLGDKVQPCRDAA
jgi:hypothetical protein